MHGCGVTSPTCATAQNGVLLGTEWLQGSHPMSSQLPPTWVADLANSVAAAMEPGEILPPVGCHFHLADDVAEVSVFASLTEMIGGDNDGLRFTSGFTIDIASLIAQFERVDRLEWQALPEPLPQDEVGAHVGIEGLWQGHRVWLRILAEPPDRFEVGRYANYYETRIVDIW